MSKANRVVIKFSTVALANIVLYVSATMFAALAVYNGYGTYTDPDFAGYGIDALTALSLITMALIGARLALSPTVREDWRAMFNKER